MRAAVIDIGTNSTKMIIGEKVDDQVKVLEYLKKVIGIGKSTFYKGRISQDIINEIVETLDKYDALIKQYEVTKVRVIATTAVREAANRDVFIDTVKRRTGFKVEVLSVGDVVYYIDAFLSYKLNKKYPINEKNLLIAELGAGSLDISILEKGFALYSIGVPVGTLRLNQFKTRIDGSQKEVYETLDEYVDNQIDNLKKVISEVKLDDIILIDESYAGVLKKILPNQTREEGFFEFRVKEAEQLLGYLSKRNLNDLSAKYDIPTDISETMDGYSLIVNKLYKLTRKRSIYILETSLVEALLANIVMGPRVKGKYNRANQLISVVKFISQKYGSDIKHCKQVEFLCVELFEKMKDLLGLEDRDLLYLRIAAYLHNVGLMINNRAHHKHSEYIINATSFFRLTSLDVKCIACIARYHRKSHPRNSHYLYGSLALKEQLLVQKLASILRIANALDGSHKQKIKKIEVNQRKNGVIVIDAFALGNLSLEKIILDERKQLFEEIAGNQINLLVKPYSG